MYKAICNTSPLHYLHQLGQLHLLRDLYGQVIVPQGVADEFNQGLEYPGAQGTVLDKLPWVHIVQLPLIRRMWLKPFARKLGKGEKQVIALGRNTQDPLLILDDRLARKYASESGFKVVGTAGVLVLAKQKGLLVSVKPLLDGIIRNGFYLSSDVYQDCLKSVGEEPTL